MSRLALALLLLCACIPEEGPLMAPGADCLDCHGGDEAKTWTAAGTWTAEGQHVWISDANGKSFTLRTNQVGNFYTAEPLVFPIAVSVDGVPMGVAVTYGGCNSCHGSGGGGAGGLLSAPRTR